MIKLFYKLKVYGWIDTLYVTSIYQEWVGLCLLLGAG